MAALLTVEGLTKRYEGFTLGPISFELEPGYIMGFIGRNGAGKTTTIKSMLNIVRPDAGRVTLAGLDYAHHELELKQQVGLTLGGVDFYPKRRLSLITSVVRRFFGNWDEAAYERYLERFELDPGKRVNQLSAGMKVKYSLALALSHRARLLILDEPTSGLDPVSRDDMLDVFREVIEDGERSILFSTHITSDLDKCADFITYIRDGQLLVSTDRDDFLDGYRLIAGTAEQLADVRDKLVGFKTSAFGFTGLARTADIAGWTQLKVAPADIESIMVYHEHSEHESEERAA